MSLAEALMGLTWVGVTAYALFGGADFGGGFWDLLAGGATKGAAQRRLIETSIGPVWEANHVWLIFAVVVFWTAFPRPFASIASSLYIPLSAAAFGIILRGSGFAFRKATDELRYERIFGATFALSSVVTPFFLGTVGGAVASGRVPIGNAQADPVAVWWNPTSVLSGVLAVGICAYLAAIYLTADARRHGDSELSEAFRRRGLWTGVIVGGMALVGVAVVRQDAPLLYAELTTSALPFIVLSFVGGIASLGLLLARRFLLVRGAAALAVIGVLWGWAFAQSPYVLRPLTIQEAAAGPSVLFALVVSLGIGSVLVVPSLIWLYVLFQRGTS